MSGWNGVEGRALATGLLLVTSLVGCGGGGGDGGGDDGGGGSTSSSATTGGADNEFPNSCELFTQADAAEYGDLGMGDRSSSDAADVCNYTASSGTDILWISVGVSIEAAYDSGVSNYDEVYADGTKSAVDYGDEGYIWVIDGESAVLVKAPPYSVAVSTVLPDDAEGAARAITQQVLAKL